MHPCLAKARPHISDETFRSIVARASDALENEGIPEQTAISRAAREVLAETQARLEQPKQSRARDVTETPAFKKWFGESKVVDEKGEPQVMYHGTASDITEFDDRSKYDGGIYFTANPRYAGGRARIAEGMGHGEAANVMPVFVRINNPAPANMSVAAAKEAGHDGIIRDNEVVAFKPEQIKSATGNDGSFNQQDKDITRSTARPVFYSQLQMAIEQMPERLSTMSAPQWKLWLDANAAKVGVKKEEIEWSGIKDYLAMRGKDKVSRDEIAAFVRDNGVRLKDVIKDNDPHSAAWREASDKLNSMGYELTRVPYEGATVTRHSDGAAFQAFEDEDGRFGRVEDGKTEYLPDDAQNWASAARNIISGDYDSDSDPLNETKYGQYTVPGGENYKEVLITLPEPDPDFAIDDFIDEMAAKYGRENIFDVEGFTHSLKPDFVNLLSSEDRARWEKIQKENSEKPSPFEHAHWRGTKNVLAHLRVDDRTDAEGKRVLFINELQSDWGQAARKHGIRGETPVPVSELPDGWTWKKAGGQVNLYMPDGGFAGGRATQNWESDADLKAKSIDLYNDLQRRGAIDGKVPNAPFISDTKSWVSLALKRAMMMAVEGGYDKVAFVTGDQAADFFDLSKRVSSILYEKVDGKDLWELEVRDHDDNDVIHEDEVPAARIEELLGKDIAEKIVNGDGEQITPDSYRDWRRLSGLDLKVGGEGMRDFYDKIVPQIANDVLKKIGGGKVETIEIPDKNGSGRSISIPRSAMFGGGHETVKIDDEPPLKQRGFDITEKMRDTVSDGVPLFSAARAARDLDVGFGYKVSDLLDSSKKVTWWDKSVGTPYHLAQKYPETFGRVYNAIQGLISDTSKYATRAADMAPNILPKLENMKDVFKSPLSAQDVTALSDPIFKGTLVYTRNDQGEVVEAEDVGTAGIVWTNDELRSMWNLDDRQIGLYREFRKATNKSIADLAITGMVRLAGKDADGVRGRVLAATNIQAAADILANHLGSLAGADPERANTLQNTARIVQEQADQARGLMAKGYAPLTRFGGYTVYAPGIEDNGYFEMFESERDANKRARELQAEFPGQSVTVGTMSQEGYKLFKGVTPETLALFGDALGLDESASDRESQVFQEYLKLTKSTRSAMKRLIHRKGVSGYSNDVGRVLASFVYSNGRQAGQNLNAGEILKSANEVPEGDLKDHAIKLAEYSQNPQEEMQAIRGLVFAQFIGGNVASALVNTTQSLTTTWPTLSQHFGMVKSGKAMADALSIMKSGAGTDTDLEQAMDRAAKDGITDPNETHQLQGQAQGRGSLRTGDGTKVGDTLAKLSNGLEKIKFVWGKGFGLAETLNRKIAFISAYKLARDTGKPNPYEFATKIVNDTQFVMNKGANPVWARGPVGATLFQFKKFSVFYLENLARMWGSGPEGKKAFAQSLAIMFVLAGAGGFPFADDLDDVIDGFAQRVLNKSFSSKMAKKEFFSKILGDAGSEFVLSGVSGLSGMPIDISGRLGLGNLIPATGLLVKKQNYGQDVQELFGAVGASVGKALQGVAAASNGDVGGLVDGFAPVAVANALKAKDMIELGQYRDTKGRKVIDTTVSEALLKGIGFQPTSVKNVQDAAATQNELIGLNKARQGEIADLWARGRIERKPELVDQAKQQLKDWNAENPDSPITLGPDQINSRVRQANMTKAQRMEKTAPKQIRAAVKQALEPAQDK